MRFLFLTPSLEPCRDGVGDYALRLAGKLSLLGHHAACVAIHDRHADRFMAPNPEGDAIPCWRFPAHASERHRMRALQAVIDSEEPDLVSLQYVPHGFQRRGMPIGLPRALGSLRGDFGWHLMFHELWTGSLRGESLRRKCVGRIQRSIVISLCARLSPRLVHTSNGFYHGKLAKVRISAGVLPLFSNIPVAEPDPGQRTRLLARAGIPSDDPGTRIYVFFGDIHPEWDPARLLEAVSATSTNSLFVSIGKVSDTGIKHWRRMEQTPGPMPRFSMMGGLPSSEISRILHAADYGATTEAAELLGKSGSVAAMLEHGLPVIASRTLGTGFLLTDPRFFFPGKTSTPLAEVRRRPPAETLGDVAGEFLNSLGLRAEGRDSVQKNPMIEKTELTVGVVVTNCNTEERLRQCVRQCDLLEPSLSDFVVIDDASLNRPDPGSERVRLLENPSNLGLTASLDRGIRECRADLVVVFDSDAYPITPFTQEVRRRFAEDPCLAMAAFPTVDSRGGRTASTDQEPGVLSILLGQKLYARIGHLMPEKPLCIFTCAMVVRKSDFLAVGGFDRQFDWLDLDLDLSMEFNRIKKRLCILDGLKAFHEGGGSPQTTSARVLRFYRNRWKLLLKHGRLPMAPLIKGLILSRLVAEWIFLLVAGRLVFPIRIAREKARGRLMIIKGFAKA